MNVIRKDLEVKYQSLIYEIKRNSQNIQKLTPFKRTTSNTSTPDARLASPFLEPQKYW